MHVHGRGRGTGHGRGRGRGPTAYDWHDAWNPSAVHSFGHTSKANLRGPSCQRCKHWALTNEVPPLCMPIPPGAPESYDKAMRQTPTETGLAHENHLRALAKRHAQTHIERPGALTFFIGDTAVCELCNLTVVMGWQKKPRKEHCKTRQHDFNYRLYSSFFHNEVKQHKALRDELVKTHHLGDARSRVEKMAERVGVKNLMDWYHVPGDQAGLKVALADLVYTRFPLRQLCDDTEKAVRRHLHYARAILCYRVAKSYLTERPGDAYTVGMLIAPYVCEVTKVRK